MSFEGVCQICEAAPAHHACPECGMNVCDEHYDRELGICSRCAATINPRDDIGPSGDTGPSGDAGPGDDPSPMR